MSEISVEIAIILLLLIANGVFAMTEIAVVAAKKAKLRSKAERGDKRAAAALKLAESPDQFFPTVQIGITLIGIFAGALGGARLSDNLAGWVRNVPFIGQYADQIGLGLVVLFITFFSLVIGELVPKRVGLNHAEQVASLMARPMNQLSRLAKPAVSLLSFSTTFLLRILGIRDDNNSSVTEDEISGLVQEGLRAGVVYPVESEMVQSVLALDRLSVGDIMTPRPRMVGFEAEESHTEVWRKIVVSNHSYFPVYEKQMDEILGIVSVKSIYANLAAGVSTKMRDLAMPVLMVPELQSAILLLETFKENRRHIALVINEFGGICGLVTINDLMEAIVGELPGTSGEDAPLFVKREDGTLLVDALVGIVELEENLPGFDVSEEEERRYATLGGFICVQLGYLPKEGEILEFQGFRFEVIDMDGQRVDKVLITLPQQQEKLQENV